MLLATEQHRQLAAAFAKEAANQAHPAELRERYARKAELFGLLVTIGALSAAERQAKQPLAGFC
jgi:hypothetical protein